MTASIKYLRAAALATALITSAVVAGAATSTPSVTSTKILSAHFDARQIAQVEVGDFHFKPGQVAPIHTHSAPAIGYVAKGTIIYQVEGSRPQILHAGDAFYEPAGPRILRFDNASATQEAIFLDFNLEQTGEPFIVFEKQPKEAIDRRTLPTTNLGGRSVDQVNAYANELERGATLKLNTNEPIFGVVAEGIVELQIDGKPIQRIIAGKTFAVPTVGSLAKIVNASAEVSAKVITFRLQ